MVQGSVRKLFGACLFWGASQGCFQGEAAGINGVLALERAEVELCVKERAEAHASRSPEQADCASVQP